MSKKRFLYRNFLEEEVEKRFTEEYDEKWGIYLSDNLTGDWYNINPVEIVDTCNELWEQVVKLREENEQLQKQVESSETTMNATSNYNAFLESKITTLEKENEQLEQKIKNKNEYQRVLEAKIRRLKDRIKVLEKNE